MNTSQVTIIVQGQICHISLPKIKQYAEKYKVIYSTWCDEDTGFLEKELKGTGIQVVAEKSPSITPENHARRQMKLGSIIYQIEGMLNGLAHVKTKYTLRLRTDEFYTCLDPVFEKFFEDDDKLVTTNKFFRRPEVFTWHVGDHIMISKTIKMQKMYALAKEIVLNRSYIPLRYENRLRDPEYVAKDSSEDSCVEDTRMHSNRWFERFPAGILRPAEQQLGVSWILANTDEELDESNCYEIMSRHFDLFDCNDLAPLMWTWKESPRDNKSFRMYHKEWVTGPTSYSGNSTIRDSDHFKQLVSQKREVTRIMQDPKSMRIKVFIVTYKANKLLKRCIESLLESDLKNFDYQINVINNYDKVSFKGLEDERINIYNNMLRPDFSTGHLARNWNQAIINGFKDLKNPDADIVVCIQSDEAVRPNWIETLLFLHQERNFITAGHGDAFHSYTPEAIKKVGLWDERFCNIGYQEADYFLRHLLHNTDGCSINDYYHSRVHNPYNDLKFRWNLILPESRDIEILKKSQSGFERKDESHIASLKLHHVSYLHFRRKWGLREDYNRKLAERLDMVPFEKWPASGHVQDQDGKRISRVCDEEKFIDAVDPGFIKSVFCKKPQDITYPYFEKDIKDMHTKSYVFNPYFNVKNPYSLLLGQDLPSKSNMLLDDKYWSGLGCFEASKIQILKKCPNLIGMFPSTDKIDKARIENADLDTQSRAEKGKLLKSMKVLCVGIGSGLSLASISDFCDVMHALDVTQENIGTTKKHGLFKGAKNIILEKLENFNFEFEDNSFDVIFVYQFLQFIPSRTLRLQILRRLNDILRLNGRLIIQRGYGEVKNSHLKVAEYYDEIAEPDQQYIVREDDWSYLDSDVRCCISVNPEICERSQVYGFAENHYTLTAPANSFFEKWIVSHYVKVRQENLF